MSGSTNTHASLSPSGAERWADCTASKGFIDKLIEDGKIPEREPDNVYAIAGTFAHDMAEAKLLELLGHSGAFFNEYSELNDRRFHQAWVEDQDFFKVTDKAILDYMQGNDYEDLSEYVDYCMTQIRSKKDRVHVEVRARLFYSDVPTDKGTCDFLIEHEDESITIVDLKWRPSGMVESYENYQLAIYCMSYIEEQIRIGFMKKPKLSTKISLATFNPIVAPHVRPWETTYGNLKKFCKRFNEAAEVIKEGTCTVFVPTEKGCKWCPAAKHKKCPALNAKVKFAMPNNLDIDTATDEDLVRFYTFYPEIASYAKQVEEHLTRLAENGFPVDGTKLVKGRDGNRKLINESEATEHLKGMGIPDKEIFTTKTKTATQMLKTITKTFDKTSAKSFEDNFTERPEGKMKLVPSTDNRPSITSVKSGLFAGLNS